MVWGHGGRSPPHPVPMALGVKPEASGRMAPTCPLPHGGCWPLQLPKERSHRYHVVGVGLQPPQCVRCPPSVQVDPVPVLPCESQRGSPPSCPSSLGPPAEGKEALG